MMMVNGIKVFSVEQSNKDNKGKVIIQQKRGFDICESNEIIMLEADGNYTIFVLTNNRKIITSRTIGDYEPLLNKIGFYRIHQSYIINLDHLKSYTRGTTGKVLMSDGSIFRVSRNRKSGFLALLTKDS